MRPRQFFALAGIAVLALAGMAARGQDKVQLDPFAAASQAYPGCPVRSPPLLTAQQANAEAHVRVERGLRCAEEGKCEPGGAYKRDPEINERIRALIAGDRRFADTAVWVTTTRKWVTLEGCVRTPAQRRLLADLVGKQPGVERVFDQLVVGRR